MLKTRISRLSTAARTREVRRTCPPPSAMLPSISIIFRPHVTHSLKRVCIRQVSFMENHRRSREKAEDMTFGCLVDQYDQLVASSFGSNSRILEKHLTEYSAQTVGKALTRSDHWLTQEMIRRFEGVKNPRDVKLNRDFVSTHQASVCAVLEKIPIEKLTTHGLISNHIYSVPRAVGGPGVSNPLSILLPC